MFKINNKNTRTTSFTSLTSFKCFYSQLSTYFTRFSSVSIVYFEQVYVSWVPHQGFLAYKLESGKTLVSCFQFIEFWLNFCPVLKLALISLSAFSIDFSVILNVFSGLGMCVTISQHQCKQLLVQRNKKQNVKEINGFKVNKRDTRMT